MSIGIRVKDVMIKEVVTLKPNDTLSTAVKKIVASDVGSLIVLDAGQPVGILTRGDVLRALVSGVDFNGSHVSEFMTSPVISATPDTDIEAIASLMRDHKIKRVPIVDNGKLLGIISQTDLIYISPALYEMIRQRAKMER